MEWLLVILIAAATTASDVLLAKGMKRYGEIRDFSLRGLGRASAGLFRAPLVPLAIAAAAVAFFGFVALVSITPVSFAVPATAASYVFETVLARQVLREHVCWRRWAGAALVACGVALLSF